MKKNTYLLQTMPKSGRSNAWTTLSEYSTDAACVAQLRATQAWYDQAGCKADLRIFIVQG